MSQQIKSISSKMPKISNFPKEDVPAAFKFGARVFHQKFGYGVINSVEGDKIRVDFEKSESKDIKASFLCHEDDV